MDNNNLIERAIEKADMPLAELIETEELFRYTPGTMTILSGDELNNVMVPCRGYMILARSRYDETEKSSVSEYAIYKLTDKDTFGNSTMAMDHNVFNYETIYELEYIGEETFENMAAAINYAMNLIYAQKEN